MNLKTKFLFFQIFPARVPAQGQNLTDLRSTYGKFDLQPGLERSASQQAAYQLLTLVVTVVIAIVSGLITGIYIF